MILDHFHRKICEESGRSWEQDFSTQPRWTVAPQQCPHGLVELHDSGPLQLSSLLSNGFGGQCAGPHSLLWSLLLCHKINMLGATLVRVNINTPAAGPEGRPGVSSPWWREGRRLFFHADSRTDTASACKKLTLPGVMLILSEGLMAAHTLS